MVGVAAFQCRLVAAAAGLQPAARAGGRRGAARCGVEPHRGGLGRQPFVCGGGARAGLGARDAGAAPGAAAISPVARPAGQRAAAPAGRGRCQCARAAGHAGLLCAHHQGGADRDARCKAGTAHRGDHGGPRPADAHCQGRHHLCRGGEQRAGRRGPRAPAAAGAERLGVAAGQGLHPVGVGRRQERWPAPAAGAPLPHGAHHQQPCRGGCRQARGQPERGL